MFLKIYGVENILIKPDGVIKAERNLALWNMFPHMFKGLQYKCRDQILNWFEYYDILPPKYANNLDDLKTVLQSGDGKAFQRAISHPYKIDEIKEITGKKQVRLFYFDETTAPLQLPFVLLDRFIFALKDIGMIIEDIHELSPDEENKYELDGNWLNDDNVIPIFIEPQIICKDTLDIDRHNQIVRYVTLKESGLQHKNIAFSFSGVRTTPDNNKIYGLELRLL